MCKNRATQTSHNSECVELFPLPRLHSTSKQHLSPYIHNMGGGYSSLEFLGKDEVIEFLGSRIPAKFFPPHPPFDRMEGCREELEAKLVQENPDLDNVDMLTKGESKILKTDTEDGEGEAKNADLDAEDTKVDVEEEQNSLMSSLEVKLIFYHQCILNIEKITNQQEVYIIEIFKHLRSSLL